MIIPIRTDLRLRHTPWMNYTIIAANVLVFAYTGGGTSSGSPVGWEFMLFPSDPKWWQFFTYQFLHAGWLHLIGNMIFLYIFGNSLEDRFGPVGYLAFYLAGGVFAGIGHMLTSSAPVLGASGSVSAVTGLFLALFPQCRVTLLWFFFVITFFDVPSMYLILFSFFRDLLFSFGGAGEVAYVAHLAGNVFGFVVGMALLGARVLPRGGTDFLAMLHHWNRRRKYRASVAGGSPFSGSGDARHTRVAREKKLDPEAEKRALEIQRMRSEIVDAMKAERYDRAFQVYLELLEKDERQTLPRDVQLDLANSAMAEGAHRTAAKAYERYIQRYGDDPNNDQYHLILGIIYHRYLQDDDAARHHLQIAAERLDDEGRRRLAREHLDELSH